MVARCGIPRTPILGVFARNPRFAIIQRKNYAVGITRIAKNMNESYQPETQSDRIVVKNRGEATAKILEIFRHEQEKNYSTLDFHNEKHPEAVRSAALEFAKIIMRSDPSLVTKDTLADIVNSAASHDSVLNVAHGEMITRFRGYFDADDPPAVRAAMTEHGITKGNERLSAEWLERELDRYVGADGNPVFDASSRAEMMDAIAATFPEFNFMATISDEDLARHFSEYADENNLEKYRTGIKVWQPHLGPESSMTALAVATGDLRGEAASNNYEDYFRSGNAEFRELNEGLRLALEHGAEAIPLQKKIKIADSMLRWVKAQVTFAMWQKILFWKSVDANRLITESPKVGEIKNALKERYNTAFDTNILKAKERYERIAESDGDGDERAQRLANIADADFQELLGELGFSHSTEKRA